MLFTQLKRNIIFFPVLLTTIINSNSSVKTNISTQVNGENSSVHTEIKSNVNGNHVELRSEESGRLNVKVANGKVEIEKSPGTKPTIIITGFPSPKEVVVTETIKEENNNTSQEKETTFSITKDSKVPQIYNFIKGFLSRLFSKLLIKS